MPVHGPYPHAGARGDVVPARGLDALLDVELVRGVDDPAPSLLGGGHTLLDCTWPANVGTPLRVHYEEDEGFYVLEGSVSITVGDDVVELKAGEHAFGPRGIPHRFDVGPEGARMVWVLTPGGFEDFVEEASVPAQALTTAPPEILPPADIAEIVLRHGMELL